ncbi:MAG: DUF3995 domain-containing protein [Bacteroidota bacterium]
MLSLSLIYVVSTILVLISFLHFYWVAGGRWALEVVVPEVMEKSFFDPDKKVMTGLYTLIVAIGLLVFAFVLLNNLPTISFLGKGLTTIGTRVIGSIFLIRAVGDFKVAGFFKQASQHPFAKYDTLIFSPLCLFLGVSCWLITVL